MRRMNDVRKGGLMMTGNTLKGFLVAMVAAIGVTACSDNESALDTQGSAGRHAISFSVTDGDATRAAGELTTVVGLRSASFGVFASYTGTTKYLSANVASDFMYNQRVNWDGGVSSWTYSPQRYWPAEEGHFISFFAYAPYVDAPDGTGCIADMSGIDDAGDAWLLYQLAEAPAQQVDLLYGVDNNTGRAMFDCQDPGIGQLLTFRFDHALACVGEELSLQCSPQLKSQLDADDIHLYIKNIDVTLRNLTAKARFYLNPSRSSGQWEPVNSGTTVTERHLVTLSTTAFDGDGTYSNSEYINKTNTIHELSTGSGLFYIPIHVGTHPQEALITVSYEGIHSDGTVKAGTVSATYTLRENPQQKELLNIVLGTSIYDMVK